MDNIYIYYRDDLPPKLNEIVTPCADGYTVYIRAGLDDAHRLKAYEHALKHIENGDFDIDCTKSVQEMEAVAHGIPGEVLKRKTTRKTRRQSAKVNFLKKIGYDFFAAAERNWLNHE